MKCPGNKSAVKMAKRDLSTKVQMPIVKCPIMELQLLPFTLGCYWNKASLVKLVGGKVLCRL